MIKSSIEKMAEPIGFDIGNSDDQVQADLLNGFFKGLGYIEGDLNLSKQLIYIIDKLTPQSKSLIGRMNDLIK